MSTQRPIIFVDEPANWMKQLLEGNMEETKIKNEVTNLDDMYVVTKRYAGKVYFARSKSYVSGYLCDTTYARGAKLFDTKENAQKVCDAMNVGRKKIKHGVEKASTFFATDIQFDTGGYWSRNLTIKNKYKSISEIGSKNYNLNNKKDNEKKLNEHVTDSEKRLKDLENKHKDLDAWKQREIERIEQDWKQRKANSQADIEQQQKYIDDLKKVDYDSIVKSVETQQDRKYKVLYGSGL